MTNTPRITSEQVRHWPTGWPPYDLRHDWTKTLADQMDADTQRMKELEAGTAAWDIESRRADRAEARVAELEGALALILFDPYGCPMCDSGKLRNPDKEHWPECGFAMAKSLLARSAAGEEK